MGSLGGQVRSCGSRWIWVLFLRIRLLFHILGTRIFKLLEPRCDDDEKCAKFAPVYVFETLTTSLGYAFISWRSRYLWRLKVIWIKFTFIKDKGKWQLQLLFRLSTVIMYRFQKKHRNKVTKKQLYFWDQTLIWKQILPRNLTVHFQNHTEVNKSLYCILISLLLILNFSTHRNSTNEIIILFYNTPTLACSIVLPTFNIGVLFSCQPCFNR